MASGSITRKGNVPEGYRYQPAGDHAGKDLTQTRPLQQSMMVLRQGRAVVVIRSTHPSYKELLILNIRADQ
jgi:hypothetical protein